MARGQRGLPLHGEHVLLGPACSCILFLSRQTLPSEACDYVSYCALHLFFTMVPNFTGIVPLLTLERQNVTLAQNIECKNIPETTLSGFNLYQ